MLMMVVRPAWFPLSGKMMLSHTNQTRPRISSKCVYTPYRLVYLTSKMYRELNKYNMAVCRRCHLIALGVYCYFKYRSAFFPMVLWKILTLSRVKARVIRCGVLLLAYILGLVFTHSVVALQDAIRLAKRTEWFEARSHNVSSAFNGQEWHNAF